MRKLAQITIQIRWFTIILVVGITAFLGFQISKIEINSDVISALPDSDPDALLFKKVGQQFGGNKVGMIILETDNVFRNDVILHVKQITDSLSMMNGISSVTSITNIMDIKGGESGFEVGKLIDEYELPLSPERLELLKERVFEKEMFRGVIVSEDATSTLIMFTLPDDTDLQKMAGKVYRMAESLHLPEKLYYAGLPMMVYSIADLIGADLKLLLPIAFLVIAVVLYFSFRTLRGVVLPLITAAIAIVWTLGIMSLTGYKMSMVTNNIPILLLAVGSAYTIHVLNKINLAREKDLKQAIISALTYIFIPVVLTALTTIVGFVAFIFGAYLTLIVDFGIFTALGTFFSALLSLFFAPALIYAFSSKQRKEGQMTTKFKRSVLSDSILKPLTNFLFLHPKYTVVFWVVLILISIASLFLIKRNVDVKDYFQKDNPARLAEDIMIEKFGGSKPIFVIFKGDIQNPDLLNTMLKTEDYIKKNPHVYSTQSIANIIVEMNDALGEGRQIPDDQDKIEQLWFLLDNNPVLSQMVNEDLTEALIISKFASTLNSEKQEFAEYMAKFINENSSPECEIILTGMPFIDMKMNKSLLSSQIWSLIIAIVALVILVGLILKSFKTGLYATAPIIAAIMTLFGVMGITGIPLNIATVLVASVALGIGVDYSIHVISNFNYTFKKGRDLNEAIRDTMLMSGKAILINVVSVSAGFLVLVFSQMVPLQYFGILMAFCMVGSGFAALTLLPVILILAHRKN